jgi:hypothetical protein
MSCGIGSKPKEKFIKNQDCRFRRQTLKEASGKKRPKGQNKFEELLPKGKRFSDGKDFGLKDSLPRPAPEGAGLRQAAVQLSLR